MKRRIKDFKGSYRKNTERENILDILNNELISAHDTLINPDVDDQVSIHVIGAPRSGTSLVTQYLVSALDLAYPSNLFAAFYRVPLFGVEFVKRFLTENSISNFESNFGRTVGPFEPHEFGYFWNMHLKYDDFQGKASSHEQHVDWKNLNLILNNIAASFDKPVVYKSFLLGFHAKRMIRENPKTLFVHVERDIVENAMSLLKFREEVYGSVEEWVSIKPRDYNQISSLSSHEQVVHQVVLLNQDYRYELELAPALNVIKINYEKFCERPEILTEEVEQRLKAMSQNVKRKEQKIPIKFTVQRSLRSDRFKVEAALRKFEKNE